MKTQQSPVEQMTIQEYLAERQHLVYAELDRLLPPETVPPETIHKAMRYSVFAGGKRIRPVLFVEMVKAQLLAQFSEHDLLSRGYRIYTTLDLDLQRAASQGARAGLIEVDRASEETEGDRKTFPSDSTARDSLGGRIPHTGDAGSHRGAGYGASQRNHVLVRRSPVRRSSLSCTLLR